MNIRALTKDDIEELNQLHDRFFDGEFERPDFTKGYLGAFIIEDNDGKVVMGGGVRPIAETILVTDKSRNPHLLGDALLEALRYALFTSSRFNIDELIAFVKDDNYAKHLIKHGFVRRIGTALMMELPNGEK